MDLESQVKWLANQAIKRDAQFEYFLKNDEEERKRAQEIAMISRESATRGYVLEERINTLIERVANIETKREEMNKRLIAISMTYVFTATMFLGMHFFPDIFNLKEVFRVIFKAWN